MLAVHHGLPYCSPSWMLAWWRARAPEGAVLRVVVAEDAGGLVGVLPLYREAARRRVVVWRQLCAGFCARIGPLAEPGREQEVAAASAEILARTGGPDIVALEGLPGGSPWPALLREAWPRRPAPLVRRDFSMPVPIVGLKEGFAEWLERRPAALRRETRRRRRRLDELSATIRLARSDELETAVAALCDLYRRRWDQRGGSERLGQGIEGMLVQAGHALGDRFQLWLLESDGAAVSAHLFVAAGRGLAAWGGGFDPDWARYAPTLVIRFVATEHAAH